MEGESMDLQWDWILWGLGALLAVVCLVKISMARRKHLQGLLREYVERQVLWIRRKIKAAELKSKKSEDQAAN